ncbi:hypothetical protein B0181_08960 [Moraxella caviae]|uniref:DNA utilization protein GntX n=1 Tax=Moraxella caviae TaxID=34060 RepID=A0A1S9ZXA6_9GAMM|nr:ComF family protein [Moraxella caviae]OOR88073.1 hypothetical protein B0181_08960 [Moraxella caviae]STZ09988.1 DNA utilization protein GntX [Moraxella caviae]VEW12961.1 DNA utilization protein GntX [Moraxella caviae]
MRTTTVRLPPCALSVGLRRLLGALPVDMRQCVLCQQRFGDGYRQADLRYLKAQAFLCAPCHRSLAWRNQPVRLPLTLVDAALSAQINPPSQTNLSSQTHLPPKSIPVFAATFYQYPINRLFHLFKDEEDVPAFLALAHILQTLPKPDGTNRHNTVILPVPSTKPRLRERGFDPALMLAKFLAYHWRLPLWQGVKRVDSAAHQRGLDRSARLENLANAFVLTKSPPVRQVVLFDDVLTTGATMSALAKAVLNAMPDARLLAVCVAHGRADFSLGE